MTNRMALRDAGSVATDDRPRPDEDFGSERESFSGAGLVSIVVESIADRGCWKKSNSTPSRKWPRSPNANPVTKCYAKRKRGMFRGDLFAPSAKLGETKST